MSGDDKMLERVRRLLTKAEGAATESERDAYNGKAAELIARYEEASKRSMTDLRWYVTLALWKSAVFMEGNYKRAVAGTTDDPYLKAFGDGVIEIAQRALHVSKHGL